MEEKKKIKKKPIYVNATHTKYVSVRRCVKALGWKISDSEEKNLLFWGDNEGSIEFARTLKRWQFYNHFPGMWTIAHKVELVRNYVRMSRALPDIYNFHPRSYILPAEFNGLRKHMLSIPKKRDRTYIIKPDTGAQGKGILIVQDPEALNDYIETAVAQHYVAPMLIDGLKFDLRIYVLVTSVDPLRIYIFDEGMARFCTEPYEKPKASNLDHNFSHLTNFSLNKKNPDFQNPTDEESADDGHKRSLSSVMNSLKQNGHDVQKIMDGIDNIIRLTLISAQPFLSSNYHTAIPVKDGKSRCFEILGFDILIDEKAKPWLIEVNCMPSLASTSPFDSTLKQNVISGALKIINLKSTFRNTCIKRFKQMSTNGSQTVINIFKPEVESQLAQGTGWRQIFPTENSEVYNKALEKAVELLFQPNERKKPKPKQAEPVKPKVKKAERPKSSRDGLKTPISQPRTPRSVILGNEARMQRMKAMNRELPKVEEVASIMKLFYDGPLCYIDGDEERDRVMLLRRQSLISSSTSLRQKINIMFPDGKTFTPPSDRTSSPSPSLRPRQISLKLTIPVILGNVKA